MVDLLPKRFFVTGTDTEVGKTYVSSLITKQMRQNGLTVFPFKPISAGTEVNAEFGGVAVNEDAAMLHKACKGDYSIEQINPIVYQEPIAPHIAAEREQKTLSSQTLNQVLSQIPDAEVTLIEGAGGWLLPLNNNELLSEWVAAQQLPVLLVVGVKLGCLNHALLTAQAIQNSGAKLCGWVANFVQPETEVARENVNYLTAKLSQIYGAQCLFEVAFNGDELMKAK